MAPRQAAQSLTARARHPMPRGCRSPRSRCLAAREHAPPHALHIVSFAWHIVYMRHTSHILPKPMWVLTSADRAKVAYPLKAPFSEARLPWPCSSALARDRGISPLASMCHPMHCILYFSHCILYICDISLSSMIMHVVYHTKIIILHGMSCVFCTSGLLAEQPQAADVPRHSRCKFAHSLWDLSSCDLSGCGSPAPPRWLAGDVTRHSRCEALHHAPFLFLFLFLFLFSFCFKNKNNQNRNGYTQQEQAKQAKQTKQRWLNLAPKTKTTKGARII